MSRHQQVTVGQRGDRHPQHGEGDAEAAVLLQPRHAQRDDRDVAVPGLGQRLAQQVYVVGRAAAAAGLRDHQRDLVRVVAAARKRVEELADDQQGGVADVVVDVFQPRVHDRAAVVL